jgi:hypothetical protein
MHGSDFLCYPVRTQSDPVIRHRAGGHHPELNEVLRSFTKVSLSLSEFSQSGIRYRVLGVLGLQKPQQDIDQPAATHGPGLQQDKPAPPAEED